MEPDWEEHGKRAGPIRNSKMVREADAVLALWNGTSTGTADTIGKARYALGDDRVSVHPIGDGDVEPSVSAVEPRPL